VYYEGYVGIAEKKDCPTRLDSRFVAATHTKPNKANAFAVHVLVAFLIAPRNENKNIGITCKIIYCSWQSIIPMCSIWYLFQQVFAISFDC
jgi:hypothetical protein